MNQVKFESGIKYVEVKAEKEKFQTKRLMNKK